MADQQKTQQQEREEQFTISLKSPISSMSGIAKFFGGDTAEDAVPQSGVMPEGLKTPGPESMFSQEDIDEYVRTNGPPPPGVQMPQPTAPSAPPGQRPMRMAQGAQPEPPGAPAPQPEVEPAPIAPEEEAPSLPTKTEAYTQAAKPRPGLETKEEWLETQKKTPWWKKLITAVAFYDEPGKATEFLEARIDKRYQEHMQGQLQERAERERLDALGLEYAKGDQFDVGVQIGMDANEFMVPEGAAGSFAGLISAYKKAENEQTVNFSTMKDAKGKLLISGAPDVDFPPDIAKSMIPLITKMMKDGKVTSWPQFVKEYPEEAKDWERFKSGLRKDEAAVVKQKFPDDLSEKRALIRDPRQMDEYLNMMGEDIKMQIGNAYMEGQTIMAVDSDGKTVDVGPHADTYLWHVRKQDPAYTDWAKNYLQKEGLAFRRPPSRDATHGYIEGLMRAEGVITGKQKPSTKAINEYANEYMAASDMTEEEFKAQSKKAIGRGELKRYKGGYRAINNQMRRDKIPALEVDKFLGYHFPEEHSTNMLRRGKGEDYVGAMTERVLRDALPGGGVVQGFGTKVDRATLEEYAQAKEITFEEALEEARQNPDIRLVGIE